MRFPFAGRAIRSEPDCCRTGIGVTGEKIMDRGSVYARSPTVRAVPPRRAARAAARRRPLALAAGADLKVEQDQLGHSIITPTADTYTSVLPETARTAAEHTAALLFPARQPSSRRPAPRRAHRRLPPGAREDHRKRRHAA